MGALVQVQEDFSVMLDGKQLFALVLKAFGTSFGNRVNMAENGHTISVCSLSGL